MFIEKKELRLFIHLGHIKHLARKELGYQDIHHTDTYMTGSRADVHCPLSSFVWFQGAELEDLEDLRELFFSPCPAGHRKWWNPTWNPPMSFVGDGFVLTYQTYRLLVAKLDSHSNNRYCNEYWDGYPGRLLVISCDYIYDIVSLNIGYPIRMKVADLALFSWSNALILFKFFKKWNFRRNMGIVQNHWTEKWIFQLSILSQRCQEVELFYPPFLLQTPPQLTTKSINQSSPTNIMTVYTNLIWASWQLLMF